MLKVRIAAKVPMKVRVSSMAQKRPMASSMVDLKEELAKVVTMVQVMLRDWPMAPRMVLMKPSAVKKVQRKYSCNLRPCCCSIYRYHRCIHLVLSLWNEAKQMQMLENRWLVNSFERYAKYLLLTLFIATTRIRSITEGKNIIC